MCPDFLIFPVKKVAKYLEICIISVLSLSLSLSLVPRVKIRIIV